MSSIVSSAASYLLERPRRPVPVVVEVPHAGLELPPELSPALRADPREIARDADAYVNELYRHATLQGAVFLHARVSRYVVDLNRFEHDVDESAVPGLPGARSGAPRGVIWCESTAGTRLLERPLTPAEFEQRLELYYRPYHRALAAEIEALRARFGHVVLVSGHSMPARSRVVTSAGGMGEATGPRRADVVPGTRGRTTAAGAVIDAVESHFRAAGLSVRHDDPYRGGATTARWGRPQDGIHAVQIEINRGLYMDEATGQRKPEGVRWLSTLCESLVARLAEVMA